MTRTIAFNSNTRKWEAVTEHDETTSGWCVIEQIWSQSLDCWVTVPQE